MSPSRPSQRITITLPVPEAADEAIRAHVAAYARELCQAIGLPAAEHTDVSWAAGRAAVSLAGGTIEFIVAGDATPNLVEQAASEALYRGRELLWSAATARRWWKSAFAERAAWPQDDEFAVALTALLREATRYGLSSRRLRAGLEALADAGTAPAAFPALLEEAAAVAAPASLSIAIAKAQYARWFEVVANEARPADSDARSVPDLLATLEEDMFVELGLLLRYEQPAASDDLEDPWFRLRWNDIPLPALKGLAADQFLVDALPDELKPLGLSAKVAIEPASGKTCALLTKASAEQRASCKVAGHTVWGAADYVLSRARRELRRNAGAFMNPSALDFMLGLLGADFPTLVKEALAAHARPVLSRILRLLLSECVSVGDLRGILEALVAVHGSVAPDVVRNVVLQPYGRQPVWRPHGAASTPVAAEDLTEFVRANLRRRITQRHLVHATLPVWLLDEKVERRLARAGSRGLGHAEAAAIRAAVTRAIGAPENRDFSPMILTVAGARRALADTLHPWLTEVSVLSYQELDPSASIQALGHISSA